MIHILRNNDKCFYRNISVPDFFYDVFSSKYKPGNAFVVAKVEGKWSAVFMIFRRALCHVEPPSANT